MKWLLWLLPVGIAVYLALRRTRSTIRRLRANRIPRFVYENMDVEALGIPVFTYHSVANPATPDSVTLSEFERHMHYLFTNGYCTLAADELHNHLVYNDPIPKKSVMITFDDGRATLWTVAYPILQRYQFKAVSFIAPGIVLKKGMRPNLSDYEAGKSISQGELLNADLSRDSVITWDEVRTMYDSGLVDFQSHTLNHTLVYCAPEIVDFVNPVSDFGYHNCGVPVIRYGDVDHVHRRPPPGTPLYRSRPRMEAARRFFDDELLRAACVDYVKRCGGHAFFTQHDWMMRLFHFATAYRQEHKLHEFFETEEEQVLAIRHSLTQSKQLIERHLPGHCVRHLCYPWHRYSILAASLAREVGYVSTFIDINPQKPVPHNAPYAIQHFLPINEYGDDPHQITRIDTRDNLVLSLPGENRMSYRQRMIVRFLKPPQWFGSR